MVVAATVADRSALEEAKPRRRLARVEEGDVFVRSQRIGIAARESRNAGKALKKVQRSPFGGEYGTKRSDDPGHFVAAFEACAVRRKREIFARRPDHREDVGSRLGSAEDAGVLRDDPGLAKQVRADHVARRYIAITQVFIQRSRDNFVEVGSALGGALRLR